jgi:hypothetical protein
LPATTLRIRFAGADAYEQAENVQAFAEALSNGNAGVASFLEVPPGIPPGELTEQLFVDNSIVEYAEGAYLNFGDESLLDNLSEIGTWLLELLAA